MIVGTAGHIDHGKTTLVRALTGTDTDRLKEEKARGISIELGYAYTPLPGGDVLGIIDVPGHEKFVHTMAAGAAGIDHALLVVAADDGVMPQTREHLAIVQLLGVRSGTIALTKVDRVDAVRVQAVEDEVRALVAGTPLADAAVFRTAATLPDDPGVAALRAHLFALAEAMHARAVDGFFRLAVDRVFTLAGQGTIVTGTVFAGRVAVGDEVTHSATGARVKVRSIHAQNRPSESGVAGQRCALNLAGIEKSAIARGDWIADARVLAATERLDVRLTLLPEAGPLAQWAPVHVHIGTTHHVAHLALEGAAQAQPGGRTRLQLVFAAPVFALPGDRFIVRNAQANRTLGGGMVIDPFAPARKRHTPQRLAYLDALELMIATSDPAEVIALAPQGLSRARLELLMGRAATPAMLVGVRQLPTAGDELLVAAAPWQALRDAVIAALAHFHERSPDEPGVNRARLGRMVLPGQAQPALLDALVGDLVDEGVLARTGAWIHLAGHRVALAPAEQTVAERVLPRLLEGRFDPPWVRDLARDDGLPEAVVRQTLRKMARAGQVFQVVKDLFYHPDSVAELAGLVRRIAAGNPAGEVRAQDFRDATGLGRKRAIQILEFFDRVGYTRRLQEVHVIRPDASW